jgi:hypothetical protein
MYVTGGFETSYSISLFNYYFLKISTFFATKLGGKIQGKCIYDLSKSHDSLKL